jgi:ubiquinone/menaquinone biosynthesis C-methylase UbiE
MKETPWIQKQYGTVDKLSARIRLNRECGEQKEDWYCWAYAQMSERLPLEARVIEFGAGKGDLWWRNEEAVKNRHWDVMVTDSSPGMIEGARATCGDYSGFAFQLQNGDEPFPQQSATMTAVVANHVLYHLKRPAQFLKEASRILKADGYLFASVTGADHLKEMYDVFAEFDADFGSVRNASEYRIFGKEGEREFSPHFSSIRWDDHPDALVIREEHLPLLIEYVLSWNGSEQIMKRHSVASLKDYLKEKLQEKGGSFRFERREGIYIAHKTI